MVAGQRLREARKKVNLTQEELAKLANINRTTLGNYETEFRQPTYDMIESLLNKCDFKIYFQNAKNGESFESKDINRKDV